MHRIDSVTATPDNTFTEGNPTIPLPPTTVSADWLNSVQEELVATILKAGLTLHKDNNSQLLQAIRNLGGEAVWNSKQDYSPPCLKFGADGKLYIALLSSGPGVANIGPKDPTDTANGEYWLDYAKSITPPTAEKYDLAQYYWFEDDMPRNGLFSCLGGVVQNFSAKYPQAAAYFETPYGQKRLVTQAQYDALHVATWHTLADGTKIGWNGIGGVNKFVWDKQADTLRLPDLAGMTPEQVGYDSLGAGGVRGDQVRNIYGTFSASDGHPVGLSGTGVFTSDTPAGRYGDQGSMWYAPNSRAVFKANNVVPTGLRNHGPRWISDARVYLGQPVL